MKGYKSTLRDLVHKIGAGAIDKVERTLYTGRLPVWLITFAVSFDKAPEDVAKDIIRYRNSWWYQINKIRIPDRNLIN